MISSLAKTLLAWSLETPVPERSLFLIDAACGSDLSLRRRVDDFAKICKYSIMALCDGQTLVETIDPTVIINDN